MLCYAECPGDEVLIPGEPCRSEDDLRAPSRIADDVRLELRLTPPAQPEEDAVRRFVRALRRAVVVVEDEAPSGTLAEFLALVRRLEAPIGSPPDVATMDLSPPASPPTYRRFRIAAHEACAWLNDALRVWITEIRPRHRAEFLDGAGCGEGTPSVVPEACLLLGTLLIPTNAQGRAVSAGIVVEETKRPLLGTMRFWQEWQLCGPTNRGERGLQGPQGLGINAVTVSGLAPSGAPTAALDATTRVLALGIPAGAPGRDGSPGAGIASVNATTLAAGSAPTAALDATTRVLALGIPAGAPGRDGSPGAGIASVTVTGLAPGGAPTAALNPTTRVLTLGIPAGAPGISTAAGAVEAPRDGSETGPIVQARILAAGLVGLAVDPRLRACNGLQMTRAAAGRVFLTWSTAANDIAEHLAGKSVSVPKVLPLPLSLQEVSRTSMLVANLIRFNIDQQLGPEMELAVITVSGTLPKEDELKARGQFMVELTRFHPR